MLDIQEQYQQLKQEIDSAVLRVLASGQYVLGENVSLLEQEIATYCDAKTAVGVASGTDALALILMALGIGKGDEVITTPFTFVATAEVVSHLGAEPVFVDIDPATFNIDPEQVEAAITPRTVAILPVHLYGQPADMNALRRIAERHHLALIEDAAQALGARFDGKPVGGLGLAGAFSFYPTKNLGGAGDGGMIVTNDLSLAEKIRLLRNHGQREGYEYHLLGWNSRLDEIQAAILRVKLKYLDEWNRARRAHAHSYNNLLQDLPLQVPLTDNRCYHVFHLYTLKLSNRGDLQNYLVQHGIESRIYYPRPLHLQVAYSHLGYREGDLPHSERASREVLSIPVHPSLTGRQIAYVAATIRKFFEEKAH